jgi:hypothetical protein
VAPKGDDVSAPVEGPIEAPGFTSSKADLAKLTMQAPPPPPADRQKPAEKDAVPENKFMAEYSKGLGDMKKIVSSNDNNSL